MLTHLPPRQRSPVSLASMPTVADATTFVDLFCGAGGLSLGLTQAGWQPMLAVDLWGEAVETHAKNLPGHPVISDDIHALTAARLRRLIDDSPDWIVGGPPCQGYSTVGRRDRSDPRNQMFREFMRVVSLLKPHGFVLENVLGLRDMSFVNEVRSAFQRLGYTVVPMVLTAADYGVPQLRRRVLFVGHRDRGVFQGPERTHAPVEYVTVFDAISDLPVVTPGETVTAYTRQARNRYQRRLRADSRVLQGHTVSAHPPHLVEAISHIPDGGNRNSIPDHLQPSSGFHNSYSRLASWMPAVAVTSNMGKPSATRCVHPFQHRGLTAREGARLQGFPDTFHFAGGIVSQRLQVANAVPPILARAIGEALDDPARWA
jgi:DNA (cytosine-5)-methyltransferase 1